MELFKAHHQWSSRPDDEKFKTLRDLFNATKAYAETAIEKETLFSDLRVEAQRGDVYLSGKTKMPARLTHWAFGQLCARLEAPASYLRELPATLACQNLSYGLANKIKDAAKDWTANLLLHKNGGLLLRSIMTDRYARIWNHEIATRLMMFETMGWDLARPDIRKEAGDFPSCYASDHDMFVFMRNKNLTIKEAGGGAVYRGVMVWNSEVGGSILGMMKFLYREMCGNHIIWGASDVQEIRVKHVGDARNKWSLYMAELKKYANESASEEEAKIKATKRMVLGKTKEEVLDFLFGKRALQTSYKTLEAGYKAVIEDQDGNPNTQWGIVQGLTRYSQTIPYADERTKVDKVAGRIMEAEF